jgi:LacI family repressor for deo operon, udp, cdd, tsx, nupC, and nupG
MAAHHLIDDPAFIQPGDWEYDSGYQATLNLLKLSESPTAIFAANDLMALGAISALQDNGLNVPKQIAVVAMTIVTLPDCSPAHHNRQYAGIRNG